ncbi:uncharacterized protein LOC114380789 [Glycine soja]|uniref:DUF4378 domain-containing protein n=1 Tax=Glycine soja TaxID=3848 RepID=A0A445HG68_GLYSO|nr:uncharacterized protein LOC114380789 [Glycine soja]RZB72663.1 hypothetical protein D0Y65_036766 [Glycine soja]
MAEKHLRELLKEDQEPFLLKHYIWERRRQLKRPSPNSTLQQQLKKKNSNFPLNKCFLTSLQNATKSPLLLSPKNSTSPLLRPSNAKTASLLLEAALRIHNKNAKPKKPKPNSALGIFGSLFKKLTNRKRETLEGVLVKVKDSDDDVVVVGSCEVGFSCSCNGRPSSAVWSESNEDKSLDLESSSSGHSFDDSVAEEIEFLNKRKHVTDSACFDDDDGFFCESPFRFSLQRSPGYSGRHTPDFSSPAASPCRRKTEDKKINGADGVNKFQSGEEEEDKEQCSPVSVLDPPFDDDDDGHDDDHEGDGFDLDCSYANVQRTKQHLLNRLRRFEKLAELDPVELEKRMLDQDREYKTFTEEDDDCEDGASETACKENALRGELMFEILCHSSVEDTQQQTPEDLKRLVYDLIKEEEREVNNSSDMVIRRVLRRLELWKEVESNTIDMMIEEDFSREQCRWKKNAEHTSELAVELELAIFCFLVEELSEELVC